MHQILLYEVIYLKDNGVDIYKSIIISNNSLLLLKAFYNYY